MNKTINKIRTFASEDNISMLLGVVILVLVGSLLFSYFKSVNKTGKINNQAVTTENVTLEEKSKNLPADYEVQAGDSLWSIAEKTYGTGHAWKDIATANSIANASVITTGAVIKLPELYTAKYPQTQTVTQAPQASPETYIIKSGDTLWNISVAIYGTGFRWPEIAKANNITNPQIIHAGNQLTIPKLQ